MNHTLDESCCATDKDAPFTVRSRWRAQLQIGMLLSCMTAALAGCSEGNHVADEPAPKVPMAESLSGDTSSEDVASSVEVKSPPKQESVTESAKEPSESVSAPAGPVGPSPPPGSDRDAVSLGDFSNAAFEGNLRVVQKGIAQGIDINKANEEGNTPLMLAAFNGHTEIVRLLISRDADVKAKNSVRRTALMFAATAPSNEAVVEALLKAGADVNAVDGGEGYTALMFAAGEGHLSIARLLLEAGADASIKDLDNETAAIHAANNNHTELARLLSKSESN